MDSLKGAASSLPPPFVSIFLVVFYLLITQGLWYGIKNMFKDSYARMMTLELIAAAEVTACFVEFQPADAVKDALSVFVFTSMWMAVLAWFEIHWLLHTPNPCIRLENVIKKEFSASTAALLVFMELFGGVIGYGSMILLSGLVKTPSQCTSPLKVSTHEGLIYTCLGALVCRIASTIFSNTDSTAHRNIKKTIEIVASLAGAQITGGLYNPLLISAMYPYCTSIMPWQDFILVYWVGAIFASLILSLTGLIALIIDFTG